MKKVISVIVPTYNHSAFLRECLESVFNCLEDFDSEVIVVDDGSTDDTEQVIGSLRKVYKDLKYKRILHTGKPGVVRNIGLGEASGEFIAFQDSDDVWAKDKITKQMSAFDDDTTLVYGNISYINKSGESISNAIIKSGKERSGYLFPSLIDVHRKPIPTSTVMAKRSAIEKAGKFNDYLPLATDIEYWIRLSAMGNFKFVDDVLTYVRRHDSNISTISEDIEGVFMDRLGQIPVYRSVLENGLLNGEQRNQLRWAQVLLIDQLKKLSGRYAHYLVKSYRSPLKRADVTNRWFSQLRDACSNFVYYIRNL